jgi:hypothetical protein
MLVTMVTAFLAQPSDAQVFTWNSTTTSSAWLTTSNWVGGIVPGEVNNAASTNANTATFGNYSTTVGAAGVGIDMGSAGGFLSLGAIDFNPTSATGPLFIGNSSTTTAGTLILNTNTVNYVSGVLIAVRGNQDLTIQDSQGSGNQSLTLQLGATSGRFLVSAGRTLTINTSFTQRQTGSKLTVDGGGTVALGRTNSFTGGVTVLNQSSLLLNFAAPSAPTIDILPSVSTVTLGGNVELNTASLAVVGGGGKRMLRRCPDSRSARC